MEIINIPATGSTNDELTERVKSGAITGPTILRATTQTAGRGQLDKTWDTQPGENLTFSIYMPWEGLLASQLFTVNMLVVAAILEVLDSYHIDALAKWPNDILAERRKLAGILIENTLQGTHVKHSIIGIGINVNQTQFDEKLKATSLFLLRSKPVDLDVLFSAFAKALSRHLARVPVPPNSDLKQNYLKRLIGVANTHNYLVKETGVMLHAGVAGITNDGRIILDTTDNQQLTFGNGELLFMY